MRYLFDHLDQLAVWGDILQMSVLELIRKVWVGRAGVAVVRVGSVFGKCLCACAERCVERKDKGTPCPCVYHLTSCAFR